MFAVTLVTCKEFIRDRLFQGILAGVLFFLFVPALSNISMRQSSELSISLALSFVSFLLLLIAVFLAGTTLWRDIDRRYIFSVLGLPISRGRYILGKYLGIMLCLGFTAIFLGFLAVLVIKYVAFLLPPERHIIWFNIIAAIFYDLLKYLILVALAFFFSSLSTSFFLPLFATISFYMLGTVSQQVYEYINSPVGAGLSTFIKKAGTTFYYIIPNFTLFNLKSYAIYAIDIPPKGLLIPILYFVVVTAIFLTSSIFVFNKRDLK